MIIVHVHVLTHPEDADAFAQASAANSACSLQEPGVVRFDVIRQVDEPNRFILVEVYRDEAATAAHKETEHYKVWRDTVAKMMKEPRRAVRYEAVCPAEEGWVTP